MIINSYYYHYLYSEQSLCLCYRLLGFGVAPLFLWISLDQTSVIRCVSNDTTKTQSITVCRNDT